MFAFIYFLVMSYNYVRQQFISVELLFQGGNGWICSTSLIQRKHRGQHPNQLPEKALPMRCLLCRYFFSVWHVNLQLSTVLYIIQTIAGKNCIAHVNHLVETL